MSEQSFEKLGKAQVRALLERARDMLTMPYGWVKGHENLRNRGHEAHCAIGAIRAAGAGTWGTDGVTDTAKSVMDSLASSKEYVSEFGTTRKYPGIIAFNDSKATRKYQVLALFNEAIESL